MPIDPKKDPARRCLPVEAWPEPDRRAWQAALCDGNVLDPGGAAADWAPHTRQKVSKGYGRWLTWLASRGLLDLNRKPAERITPKHLRDYVGDLTVMNAPYTVLARVQELYQAIGAMVPGLDWAWLRHIERRLRHKAVPVRDKRLKVVSSESLLAFGVELMSAADDPGTGTPLKRALRYRDGLIIVLLAARPLRRRDFMRIEIGTNLVRQGEVHWIRFANGASKTGMLIDVPVPDALVPRLERYLSEYRPILLRRSKRLREELHPDQQFEPALWISVLGTAMSEDGLYFAISRLTRARFGHVIGPHLFRDGAATSIAIDDPEHVQIISSVLGHTTLRTAERHYLHAKSLEAFRRYQRGILELRRKPARHHKN